MGLGRLWPRALLGEAAPTAQLLTIPSGAAGVNATLRLMATLAKQGKVNPAVRQRTARIVQACAPKDQVCEVQALQRWVQTNIRYLHDVLDVETLQPAEYTLEERYGDCDDQSILLASMLMSISIPAAFCVVGVNGGPFSHVMTMAIIRQHDQVIYSPCETTMLHDPDNPRQQIGPGWFPPDATCTKVFHI